LTTDHAAGSGPFNRLTRAIGAENEVRIEYLNQPLEQHDRFLLCTDGVYKGIGENSLHDILARRASPDEDARELVETALSSRVDDNATALIIDAIDLPPMEYSDLANIVASNEIHSVPAVGDMVDGFRMDSELSDSRYVRVFRATDTQDGRAVVVKFPKPLDGADAPMREAFLRELWISSRVRSAFVGEVLQLEPDRQTQLYLAIPFYQGETLEARLQRKPSLSLSIRLDIVQKIAKGVAAMHRAGIVHRDIKPDNVIIGPVVFGQALGVKLVDFGVARQLLRTGHAKLYGARAV
jgi:serine/threonine protein kinase